MRSVNEYFLRKQVTLMFCRVGASERFQNRGGHDFVLDIFCTPANSNISIIVA